MEILIVGTSLTICIRSIIMNLLERGRKKGDKDRGVRIFKGVGIRSDSIRFIITKAIRTIRESFIGKMEEISRITSVEIYHLRTDSDYFTFLPHIS